MSVFLRLWRTAPKTSATALAVGGGATGWVGTSDDPRQAAYSLYACPVRLGRCAATGAIVLADYKWNLRGLSGEALEAELRRCHLRSAARMVKVAGRNGGVYIKAGQHLGQMDHLLPAEYVRTFRCALLDKCPVSSPTEVRRVFVNDFGAAPEEVFASFEPAPIASASLAQVHRAVGRDGRQLAVKVQHAGLRESGAADTATIGLAVALLRYFAPDYDYRWVVDETRTSLPLELDFQHEAGNMARCAANLSSPRSRVAGDVAVPQAVPDLTSKRVLTMEYMDGVGVNDIQGLVDMGADMAEVSHLISEAFAEMVFTFGDVHCDPHAANMKIRLRPASENRLSSNGSGVPDTGSASSTSGSGSSRSSDTAAGGTFGAQADRRWFDWLRPWRRQPQQKQRLQLVLLDHGLYRQLDDGFRLQYARMWQALVMADERGIRSAAAAMGAGDTTELFAGVLTQRPWSQVVERSSDHLRVGRGGEAERQQLNEYAQQFAADAAKLLQRVPRALLLLLKTNDCLRSVDASLGQPVNTFLITARACDRALASARWQQQPGAATLVRNWADRARLEWRLALFRAAGAVVQLQAALQRNLQRGLAVLGVAPQPAAE